MVLNPTLRAQADTREVSRHLALVQPSSALSSATYSDPAKAERIREKVRIRTDQEKEKKLAAKKARAGGSRSALVPGEGAGMSMTLDA